MAKIDGIGKQNAFPVNMIINTILCYYEKNMEQLEMIYLQKRKSSSCKHVYLISMFLKSRNRDN